MPLLISLLLSVNMYAGKNVVPVSTPVIAVPYINPFYIGAGILWTGMKRNCACSNGLIKEDTYGGIVRAGYDFNKYIGIESRALYSSIQKDVATTEHYGVYLKPMIPIGDSMNVYGLLGYGKTKIDCIISSRSYDKNGFGYGIGFEYDLSGDDGDDYKDWGIWADYQNLLSDSGPDNVNSNIVTAGLTYDF